MKDMNGKLITDGLDGGLDEDGMIGLVNTALTGDPTYLIEAIEAKGQELMAALARSGGPIRAQVVAIQDEYRAMLEIRMTLLQSEAIDTLKDVMSGRHLEGAGPMVSAANSILSRGMFPAKSRQESLSLKIKADDKLPGLGDVIKGAKDEQERLALADELTSIAGQLTQMRGGESDDDQEA